MLVRATQRGYYGVVIREPGHTFRLSDPKHFADHADPKLLGHGWMEKVEGQAQAPKKGQKAQLVGNRPAPPDEDEVARRVAEADRMAQDAAREDKEAEVI